MTIERRALYDGNLLRVGHVVSRPLSAACGEIERQSSNILVLPLAGVFAKHDGPRRHVIATPNHAVFIAAGSPYRLSYPGGIGDQALTLRFSRDSFEFSDFAAHSLLSPAAMLARSLLWRRFVRGEWDPLQVEEVGLGLLAAALPDACKVRHAPRRCSGRRMLQVERVKEAISLRPERKWTLSGLAELACVSPCHLAHIFRAEVGASVYRYVLRARLAKALEEVLEGDTDLSAVALETGFASHSHFTARFRALFGSTPVELRQRASRGTAAKLRKIVTARELAAV